MNFKENLLKFKEMIKGQANPKQVNVDKNIVEHSSKQKEDNTGKCVVTDRFEYTEEEITKMMELMRNENKISSLAEAISKAISEMYPDCLDDKVDDFIDWYFENMVKGNYTDIGEYHKPKEMRNFIEKMAVWYELRYPDYEINRLMPGSSQASTKINEVMFQDNLYIKNNFDENSDINLLEWDNFYNTKAFINSLPWEERYLFAKAKYKNLVYIDSYLRLAHLHLTPKGFVELAEEFESYTDFKVKDDELKGMHAKDVVKFLKEKGISLPKGNELEETIKNVEKLNYQKEEMLNCVMYRIIERGGNRIGPRRAFLFAKEFNLNINIPMIYGIDFSDPGLRDFVNEYIKAGGSIDLECYQNYFSKTRDRQKLKTIKLGEIYKFKGHYTPEEKELYQRLATALAASYNQEELEKEKVKQLRIERKLNKSRNN